MLDLIHLGDEIARNRRLLELSQLELAAKAHVSPCATLDALENHRTREIGFSKLVRILAALGLETEPPPKPQPADNSRTI